MILVLLASLVLAEMVPYDESVNKIQYDVNMQLYEGWNLIPAVCNTGIDGIKAANIRTMYVFNPDTLQYVNIFHNGQLRNNDELVSIEEKVCSSSWWVHVTESTIFDYRTDYLPKLEDKQIFKGWNFLIITPEMANDDDRLGEQFEAKDFAGSCDIEKSFAFDPSEQQWVEFPLEEEFYQEVTGFGWAVRAAEDCKMGFEEQSIGAPPALPE